MNHNELPGLYTRMVVNDDFTIDLERDTKLALDGGVHRIQIWNVYRSGLGKVGTMSRNVQPDGSAIEHTRLDLYIGAVNCNLREIDRLDIDWLEDALAIFFYERKEKR